MGPAREGPTKYGNSIARPSACPGKSDPRFENNIGNRDGSRLLWFPRQLRKSPNAHLSDLMTGLDQLILFTNPNVLHLFTRESNDTHRRLVADQRVGQMDLRRLIVLRGRRIISRALASTIAILRCGEGITVQTYIRTVSSISLKLRNYLLVAEHR